MRPLFPGQAGIARVDGKVCIVVCEHPGNIALGDGSFDLRGQLHEVTIQGVTVAALRFVFVLTTAGSVREYAGWINELEEHVVESLGTAKELTIVLAGPDAKQFAE